MNTEFRQKVAMYATGGVISLAVAMGSRLGLLHALHDVSSPSSPATPKQVADKANCNERYVKEWLACLACADIIEVNEEEKFWIAEANVNDLVKEPFSPLVQMTFMPLFTKAFDKLEEAIRNDSPRLGLDYSDFTEFYDLMGLLTESWHKKALIPKMLPDVGHEIVTKLKTTGLKCLDVGCGNGFHANLLATNYPKSDFTGLDLSETALKTANKNKEKDGLTNLNFVLSNAGSMPAEWTNTFDYVTIFDACHDQMRPDLCIKEIHRVLKPGGIFSMIEVSGTGNVAQDKQIDGVSSGMMYGLSLFHCLPVASNSPDALCFGNKWGIERGQKLLRDGGFEDVSVKDTPYFPINCLYVCKKQETNKL